MPAVAGPVADNSVYLSTYTNTSVISKIRGLEPPKTVSCQEAQRRRRRRRQRLKASAGRWLGFTELSAASCLPGQRKGVLEKPSVGINCVLALPKKTIVDLWLAATDQLVRRLQTRVTALRRHDNKNPGLGHIVLVRSVPGSMATGLVMRGLPP